MNDVATKDDVRGVMSAFEEFKSANDARLAEIAAKGGADPVLLEKLGKIETTLDAGEKLNQKVTAELLLHKSGVKEMLDSFEVKLNRLGLGVGGQHPNLSREEKRAVIMVKACEWARAVHVAITKGLPNCSEEQVKAINDVRAEYKALNLTDDAAGGYLAPVEFVQEILKTVVLISPVRALAMVRTTAMKSIRIPRRTALLSATWEDEEQTATPATGLQYGLLEVFTKSLRAIVDISNDMLEDAAFDMAAEILAEVSEQFAVAEGAGFVNGVGPNQPEGFLTNVTVTGAATHTTNATSLTADSVINCYHTLKTAYARNGVWAMNRQTVGQVRQLKDGVGQYLFMMGLPNGAPNTVIGAPYVEVPDMPAVAAGAYPVAFGDFNRGYSLVDRLDMQMLRDPYTQAAVNNVRYLFRKRLGGKVTMAEAIQLLLVGT